MSADYHIPIVFNSALTSANVNTALGQLDSAIRGTLRGDAEWIERSTAPSIPASGSWHLYFKSSGLYMMDDAGAETYLSSAGSFSAQSANTVLAGPTTGAAAAPGFRAIVPADINSALTTALTTPPPIGATTPNTAAFSQLSANTGLSPNGVVSLYGGGVIGFAALRPVPEYRGLAARRSASEPYTYAAIQSTDTLMRLSGRGTYDATGAYSEQAAIAATANQDWTTTAKGSRITVSVTPDGSTTLTQALVIHNDNRLEIEGTLDHDGSQVGFYGNTPVSRPTYGAPTGTPTRTTFDTSTVTLSQLAERVKALVDDLRSVGLLG